MFSIGNSSFIDQLLFEYDSNQKLINKNTSQSLDSRTQQLFYTTAAKQPTPAIGKVAKKQKIPPNPPKVYPEPHISVPESQQAQLQGQTCLDLALSAFKQRLDLTIKGQDCIPKYDLLGELYLQGILQSAPGLHLFIVAKGEEMCLANFIGTTVFANGMKRAWQKALQDPTNHERLLVRYIELLQDAYQLKLPDRKFNNHALRAVLSLLTEFPEKLICDGFRPSKTIFTDGATRKAGHAAYLHLKNILNESSALQAISAATKEALYLLRDTEPNSLGQNHYAARHLCETLQKVQTACADMNHKVLAHELKWSLYLFPIEKGKPYCIVIYHAFYVFVSRLCAISLEESKTSQFPDLSLDQFFNFISNFREMATVIKNKEHLYTQANPLSCNKTVVIQADALDAFTKEDFDLLFSLPLRSYYLYGHDQTVPQEWQKLLSFLPKIAHEAKSHSPQEPLPFHALFTETIS